MRISPTRPGSGRRTFALALAACGLLAGCGTSGIQVEREAHLPPGSAGASFMVLAARGQDSDPGYARNAELVAAELTARHFVRVTEPAAAHFAVMVWERSRDTPARATRLGDSSTSGSRGRGRGGSFGGGAGMSGGGRTRGDSSPVETSGPDPRPVRRVEIQIYDITQPQGPGQHVFNATARLPEGQAGGGGAAEMIAAALRNFPGREQESYTVPVTR